MPTPLGRIGAVTTSPYPAEARYGNDPETGGPYVIPPRPDEGTMKASVYGANLRTKAQRLRFLRSRGYPVGNKWDDRAKSAWRNLQSAARLGLDPEQAADYWRLHSAHSPGRDRPLKVNLTGPPVEAAAPGTTPRTRFNESQKVKVDKSAAAPGASPTTVTSRGATGGASKTSPAIQRQIAGSLLGIKLPNLRQIPESMLKMLGQPYGEELIESLAGTDEIDRSVNVLKSMVEQNTRDTEARIGDIDRWYGQVQTSLGTAAARDKAIDAASLASIKDVAQGVVGAIGGEANPGSGMAAQAGVQGADLIAAMGNAQEEYNADVAPLIAAEAAGQKAQTSRESDRRAQELNLQIGDVESGRDTALADARLKLAELNRGLSSDKFQALLGIRQANLGSAQQMFENRLGLGQARQAAVLAAANFGLDMDQQQMSALLALMGLQQDASESAADRAAQNRPDEPSQSALRQSHITAMQAVEALRQRGHLHVQNGVQAIKSSFGITARSPRSQREAAWRSATQALPNVNPRLLRRYFNLG